MTVEATAGFPDFKTNGLIPDLYADQFNVEYWATTLMPQITTGKYYEKVLQQGDKVTVPTAPIVSTRPHKKGAKLEYETPVAAPVEMFVNRARTFGLLLDDIDEKQSHLDIGSKYMESGLKQVSEDNEKEFFADIYTKCAAANTGATAGAVSGAYNLGVAGSPLEVKIANATDIVTRVRAVLGEQNAHERGKMWLVIPEWMRYKLINSELRKAMDMGDDKSVLRTSRLGSIDGLTIYVSNLLHSDASGTYIMGGNMDAISHVAQLNSTEKLRDKDYLGTFFRGLFVYDWCVRKPEGLVTVYATLGTET